MLNQYLIAKVSDREPFEKYI